MPIRVLDEHTANQIAAGEVVERPASIVKELVENAIDAGAGAIIVDIRDGGIAYIRVADNGCGIPADELETAFLRHATSKLTNAAELHSISSMGFRGEALASIAAVSEVEALSRVRTAQSGAQITMNAGKSSVIREAGCPEGTSIVVRNLFFNTPARLKFLKRPSSEAGVVGDIIAKLILANPSISIKYTSNGKLIYHSPGDASMMNAAISVLGAEAVSHLTEVEHRHLDIYVCGLAGDTTLARGNRSQQTVIINGRYVRHYPIASAVEEAYEGRIMTGRFPLFILNISMPPALLDVNVHPSKTEVRIKDEWIVRDAIKEAVRIALSAQTAVPLYDDTPDDPQIVQAPIKNDGKSLAERVKNAVNEVSWIIHNEELEAPSFSESIHASEYSAPSLPIAVVQKALINEQEHFKINDNVDYILLGQAFGAYIIIQKDDYLYIIDQHAAHERLNYEKLRASLEMRDVRSQALLVPYVFDITESERALITENAEQFERLGFSFEFFGARSIRVNMVPDILGEASMQDFFFELLDDPQKLSKGASSVRDRLIQIACKCSVKAGDALTDTEIRELLKQIGENGVLLTCPHGRPVLISIAKKQIEKRFGRL